MQAEGKAKCGSPDIQRDLGFTTGSVNAATDFILAAYPIALFRHSQTMPVRKKIFICLLMSAGVIGGASGIAKAYQIQNIESSHDQTWDTSLLWVWTWSELWIILIAACLPPLAPFFKDVCCCIYPREPRVYLQDFSDRDRRQHTDQRAWLGLQTPSQLEMAHTRKPTLRGDDMKPMQRRRRSLDSMDEDERPLSRNWYRQLGLSESDSFEGQACELKEVSPSRGDRLPENGIAVTKDVSVNLERVNEEDAADDEGKSRCSAW